MALTGITTIFAAFFGVAARGEACVDYQRKNAIANDPAIVGNTVENAVDDDLRPDATVYVVRASSGAVSREAAAALFVRHMCAISEFDGHDQPLAGATLPFKAVVKNYEDMAAAGNWPKMSAKVFSGLLIANGCRRIHPNDQGYPRKRYPNRSVLIVFSGEGSIS